MLLFLLYRCRSSSCSCFTGVAANCASALAQMSAASCVQEEKEEKEIQEPSDAIAQGNYMIKLPTSSYIACKAATGKHFATRSGISLCCSAVHHLVVGTWDVCLQYMSCCPGFLTLCHTNYILYGTEIIGTMHKPTAFFNLLNLVLFKLCDTSTTREPQRNNLFGDFFVLGGNVS